MIPKQAIFASTFGTLEMFDVHMFVLLLKLSLNASVRGGAIKHIVFSKDVVDKLEYKPQNKIQPCFK